MRLPLADLELQIGKLDTPGFPVKLVLNHEQHFAGGHLPGEVPKLLGFSAENARRLSDWLFSPPALRDAWARIRGQFQRRRVRLNIDPSAPELHALPWESMLAPDPAGPREVARDVDTPFSRYFEEHWPAGRPLFTRTLRILAVIADPTDLGDRYGLPAINRYEELERLNALQQSRVEDRSRIELHVLRPPTSLARIRAALLEGPGYHVLHFIGHGAFSRQDRKAILYLSRDLEGVPGPLVMPADSPEARDEPRELEADSVRTAGSVELVDEEAFASMLESVKRSAEASGRESLRMVFLMSCQTARRSPTPGEAYRGLAPTLLHRVGVAAVLAMQDFMPVRTGQAFAEQFYRRLCAHGEVDRAANEARAAVAEKRLPGPSAGMEGHVVPALFLRLPSGALLEPPGQINRARHEEDFWPFLIDSIRQNRCIPILGPRMNTGLVPGPEELALQLAEEYKYPLPDTHDLARVLQFMSFRLRGEALRDTYLRYLQRGLYVHLGLEPRREEERFRDGSFPWIVYHLNWAERVLQRERTTVYHELSRLPLSLYLTTNADPFMVAALNQVGRQGRQVGPRWGAVADAQRWRAPGAGGEPAARRGGAQRGSPWALPEGGGAAPGMMSGWGAPGSGGIPGWNGGMPAWSGYAGPAGPGPSTPVPQTGAGTPGQPGPWPPPGAPSWSGGSGQSPGQPGAGVAGYGQPMPGGPAYGPPGMNPPWQWSGAPGNGQPVPGGTGYGPPGMNPPWPGAGVPGYGQPGGGPGMGGPFPPQGSVPGAAGFPHGAPYASMPPETWTAFSGLSAQDPRLGTTKWLLGDPPPEQPLVFHLNGYPGDLSPAAQVVLTEEDYLQHLVRLSRDRFTLLPSDLLGSLSSHTLLLLGFDLNDWSFRVVLHGLLSSIAQVGERRHVGVQIEIEEGDTAARERAGNYLCQYLGKYDIDVYWGTSRQFMADLLDHWEAGR